MRAWVSGFSSACVAQTVRGGMITTRQYYVLGLTGCRGER